jgi:transposase InsO family protein
VNHKKIQRLWDEEGPRAVVRRRQKGVGVSDLPTITEAESPGDVWAIDVPFDSATAGKPFKILSIVDEHTGEALGGKPHSLGPPGTGKTHLATALGVMACQTGHRVLLTTASDWVVTLNKAHQAGRLDQELKRVQRYALIIIDEVGYLPFGRWAEVFGDQLSAEAKTFRYSPRC